MCVCRIKEDLLMMVGQSAYSGKFKGHDMFSMRFFQFISYCDFAGLHLESVLEKLHTIEFSNDTKSN